MSSEPRPEVYEFSLEPMAKEPSQRMKEALEKATNISLIGELVDNLQTGGLNRDQILEAISRLARRNLDG